MESLSIDARNLNVSPGSDITILGAFVYTNQSVIRATGYDGAIITITVDDEVVASGNTIEYTQAWTNSSTLLSITASRAGYTSKQYSLSVDKK